MNLKTTLVLLILVVAGGVLFQFGPDVAARLGVGPAPAAAADDGTLSILETELTPDKLRRIEVRRGDRIVVFERDADGTWSLPGKWPTRKQEVDQLVAVLTTLRSRFAPIPMEVETETPQGLDQFGLEEPVVTVLVRADNKEFRLAFGEEPGDGNRYSRATFLRLAEPHGREWQDKAEIVRLAPGLVAALDRPLEFYQQRKLFPSERIAKESDSTEKVERLTAKSVSWTKSREKEKGTDTITLIRDGEDWKLEARSTLNIQDRPDPDKVKALLTAVPDIWAEQFVTDPKKKLADYGLDQPAETLTVTRPSGDTVILLLGKESPRVLERTVSEPAPPGMPIPAMTRVEKEKLRYAKLKDNDQVFEIKADRLKDILVAADSLRDSRLARFRTEDVTQVEVAQGGKTIVLVKEKDKWRLRKPVKAPAETARVTELLDELSRLEARGGDINDKPNLKDAKLDPPAGTVTVTIQEEIKAADGSKTKKSRTVQFRIGKHDKDHTKLLVQVAGWPRVNSVKDELVKLMDRPAVAYRGRTIFDLQPADVKWVEVERTGSKEEYTLEQTPDAWQLTVPVKAAADTAKAADLVRDLCHLNAQEYVNDTPSDEDLKKYGLDQPALRIRLKFDSKDSSKSPQKTLLIGNQQTGKTAYFAKLAATSEPAVFTIPKELRDAVDRPSLAYRPTRLWEVAKEDVKAVVIRRGTGPEYRLVHADKTWKVAGPFDAAVDADRTKPLLELIAVLRCERYENHGSKELAKYGLDKPFLRLVLQEGGKDKKEKEHVLLIGKPTAKDEPTRFAKLGDDDAIIVVGGPLVRRCDVAALDYLDRGVLKFDSKNVARLRGTNGEPPWTIARNKDAWEVTASDSKFTADGTALASLLLTCSNLEAERFAAYGPKIDLAKYGLDKPAFTVTLTVQPSGKDAKPVEHVIQVGKPAEGENAGRFARVDGGPGVVVLDPRTAAELERTYLDFVERTLLNFDSSSIASVVRKMKDQELELAKRDDGWLILKPVEAKADAQSLDALAGQLAKLRAARIAAYPAKDLKMYGLDEPSAVVTIRLGDGADKQHILKIGKEVETPEKAARPDRYAQVEGSKVVAILPGSLVQQFLAKPIRFHDRTLARFANADKVQLEFGPRKATFAQVDGTWKLVEPTEAEAEQNDLDEFINAVARLRADELVEEKPADLKPYGLDRPEIRWRFHSGDKEVLNLVIGALEKNGPRCYAKLGSGDVVFLLSPPLTKRVMAEYRNRALWPPLDAAQVEHIEFKYPEKSFALEKVDNAWQVIGMPKAKVNTTAVNETLAALAALKAERTVLDKDADLKLFGLEPPQLVLEVRTKTGAKRVLEIGRSEGESKRSYARVVGGNRADVVIISESDGAKIVRGLAGFIEK